VTAVLDVTADATADGPSPTSGLASWPARAGALCLDVLLGIGVLAVLVPLVLAGASLIWGIRRWRRPRIA